MQISAQVSLYPLRQERLSPSIEEAWKILKDSILIKILNLFFKLGVGMVLYLIGW